MKIGAIDPMRTGCLARLLAIMLFGTAADAATVAALGASNTYGKGVARSQAYPAQLEAILRARGVVIHVVNAGINGDTTEEMSRRLDSAVPNGTRAVDFAARRKRPAEGLGYRTAEIRAGSRPEDFRDHARKQHVGRIAASA